MLVFTMTRRAVAAAGKSACLATVAMLVACNAGSPLQPGIPDAGPAAGLARSRPSHGSWMDRRAKGQRLLYISDTQKNAVYVYSATSNNLVGTLIGFSRPVGECVDAKNDVWIVDSKQVAEYAHGGTTPIDSIGFYDGGFNMYSCAVDPLTGDIAIGVNYRYEHDAGYVVICATPSSDCSFYQPTAAAYVYFMSYDKNGNLYVDGLNRFKGTFGMAVRPAGGRFKKMTIKGATITSPGGLVNKDGVLSLGTRAASGNSIVYQLASDGTVTGTTQLTGADGCMQFAIVGDNASARVTCPNSGGANVTKYKYPAGGNPVVTISGQFKEPFAAVYSNP